LLLGQSEILLWMDFKFFKKGVQFSSSPPNHRLFNCRRSLMAGGIDLERHWVPRKRKSVQRLQQICFFRFFWNFLIFSTPLCIFWWPGFEAFFWMNPLGSRKNLYLILKEEICRWFGVSLLNSRENLPFPPPAFFETNFRKKEFRLQTKQFQTKKRKILKKTVLNAQIQPKNSCMLRILKNSKTHQIWRILAHSFQYFGPFSWQRNENKRQMNFLFLDFLFSEKLEFSKIFRDWKTPFFLRKQNLSSCSILFLRGFKKGLLKIFVCDALETRFRTHSKSNGNLFHLVIFIWKFDVTQNFEQNFSEKFENRKIHWIECIFYFIFLFLKICGKFRPKFCVTFEFSLCFKRKKRDANFFPSASRFLKNLSFPFVEKGKSVTQNVTQNFFL